MQSEHAEVELAEVERRVRDWMDGGEGSLDQILRHLKDGRHFASGATVDFAVAASRSDAIIKSWFPTFRLLRYRLLKKKDLRELRQLAEESEEG